MEPATGPALPTQPTARTRTAARAALIALTATAAAITALNAYSNTTRNIGPLRTSFGIVVHHTGGIDVAIPPLGQLRLPTHNGPLQIRATVLGIDTDHASELLRTTNPTRTVTDELATDTRHALTAAALRAALIALLAAALVTSVVFRTRRAALGGTATVAALLTLSASIAAATARPEAITEPKFTGLLTQAPALIGRVQDFDAYGQRVAQLTSNVARVYSSIATLPEQPAANSTRILWVSDIHNNPQAFPVMRQLAKQFNVSAIIDSGDIVDLGTDLENSQLTQISSFGIPYLYARGNHDSPDLTQAFIAAQPHAHILEPGQVININGVRITGAGDPLFRTNKTEPADITANNQALRHAGQQLRHALQTGPAPADVAVVHEPKMAAELSGAVPLTLSGHTHQRRAKLVDKTLHLTQGSSGGAGLRTFDTGAALPLEMSVLHFDTTGALLAVDDVTIGGLGRSSVTVERHTADSYGTRQSTSNTRLRPAD